MIEELRNLKREGKMDLVSIMLMLAMRDPTNEPADDLTNSIAEN